MAEKTFHSITLPGQDTARVPLTAAEFSTSVAYKVKDYCTYQGKLYRCTTAHAAGAWNAAHFTETNIDNEFDRKLDIPISQANAPANPRVGDLWIDNDENSPIYNVDASPTLNSTNAVQSGGTKVALNSLDSRKMEHGVITGDFSVSVDYRIGDLVFYATTANGITTRTLYRCTTDHNAAAWNAAHFTATTLEVELQKVRESEADTDMIGDLFGAKSIYAVGDYCIYNDNLYRCIRAVDNSSTSTPAFNPDDWTQVKLANDVNDLNSALNQGLALSPSMEYAWEQGTVYASTSGSVTLGISDTRCRLLVKHPLRGIIKVEAKDGYEIALVVAETNGSTFGNVITWNGFAKSYDISEYTESYATLFSVHKIGDGAITPTEAEQNVVLITALSRTSEIDSINTDINKYIKTKKANFTEQTGIMYHAGSDTTVFVSNGHLIKVQIEPNNEYFFTSSGTANGVFNFVDYFDNSNNHISGEYPIRSVQTEYELAKLTIPANAAWFYVNGRNVVPIAYNNNNNNTTLYEIDERVKVLENSVDKVTEMYPYVMCSESEYLSEEIGKLFYYTNRTVINSADGYLKKIEIQADKKYYVTSSARMGGVGFAFVNYFDSSDVFLGKEFDIKANTDESITFEELTIPANATWFYVNGRYANPIVYIVDAPTKVLSQVITEVEELKDKQEQEQKTISILFVGNSLTQDGIAYLPYLLKIYYPEISFKIYMWYNGGFTLAQHYEKFVNDEACEQFSVAENAVRWSTSSKTMSYILSNYTFDIVSLQEYFNYKETYVEADLQDWTNCRDYIQSHYTGGNALKFVSLFHAPLRASAATVFDKTKAGNALILQKTISEDMIPVGIAVYRALSTNLDSLGDRGHLSPDGTHTQEGLPCLLQTYVALQWVLDKLSIPKSVYGFPFKMTAAIQASINVPGANMGTGVIEGTDAENLLAQEVAIKAYKEGKQFVINNEYLAN